MMFVCYVIRMSPQESCYISLLGLAEFFRSSSPPDIPKCIQCLQAVLTSELPTKAKVQTHFQMGCILFTYTRNIDMAIRHLECTWMLCYYTSNAFGDSMFEAASSLAVLYEQQGRIISSVSILKRSVELSQYNAFWHCRLLFQLAEIYVSERMYVPACELLGIGVEYAKISCDKYNEALFLTSQCMVFLIDKNFPDGVDNLAKIEILLLAWEGGKSHKIRIEGFFLVLQVCYFMMLGRLKTAEPYLKRLQKNVQIAMSLSPDVVECEFKKGPELCWMSKDHFRLLVYLLTVIHRVNGGRINKALKYAEKTLVEIKKSKTAYESDLLVALEVICIEQMVVCKIITGRNCDALTLINSACSLCSNNPKVMNKRRPQLNVLLGLLAMAMKCEAAAEKQLNAAMKLTVDEELKTYVYLNLAVLYVRGRQNCKMNEMLVHINPANFPSSSHSLRTAAYFIFGLLELLEGRYSDAVKFLKEVVKMANAEYSRRLTSCSLILLGHMYLIQDRRQQCLEILTAAMELTASTGDVHAQLWGFSVLKDLHKIGSDAQREVEFSQKHTTLSNVLMTDLSRALKMPEYCLIYWTRGDVPSLSSLMEV